MTVEISAHLARARFVFWVQVRSMAGTNEVPRAVVEALNDWLLVDAPKAEKQGFRSSCLQPHFASFQADD
jgi:hypothetical protein